MNPACSSTGCFVLWLCRHRLTMCSGSTRRLRRDGIRLACCPFLCAVSGRIRRPCKIVRCCRSSNPGIAVGETRAATRGGCDTPEGSRQPRLAAMQHGSLQRRATLHNNGPFLGICKGSGFKCLAILPFDRQNLTCCQVTRQSQATVSYRLCSCHETCANLSSCTHY